MEEQLLKLMLDNPTLPVRFDKLSTGDSTLMRIKKVSIQEIYILDSVLYVRSTESNHLYYNLFDFIAYQKYPKEYKENLELISSHYDHVRELTNNMFKSLTWDKIILVELVDC